MEKSTQDVAEVTQSNDEEQILTIPAAGRDRSFDCRPTVGYMRLAPSALSCRSVRHFDWYSHPNPG